MRKDSKHHHRQSINNNSNNSSNLIRLSESEEDEDSDAEDDVYSDDLTEGRIVIDIIELVFKLFTTSFGVVVFSVLALNIFLTTLAIPFIKALFSLNALVSSVGIIVEMLIYDVL
uniref:Uncharacterized protein n=1 Tax=Lygus hesperus TaxID=30085 RepID=A0A146L5Y1_LYGHE